MAHVVEATLKYVVGRKQKRKIEVKNRNMLQAKKWWAEDMKSLSQELGLGILTLTIHPISSHWDFQALYQELRTVTRTFSVTMKVVIQHMTCRHILYTRVHKA